jgi:hypothetical protein
MFWKRNNRLDKKVEIKDHEFICTRCNGTGRVDAWKAGDYTIEPHCPDCGGDGKFDWIERIMGKKKDSWWSKLDLWAAEAAQRMANEIDKEIIKSICGAYKEE